MGVKELLNGILVIDKEQGMTSADVIYHLRRLLHIRKMGHAGTLDPEVTGVLPVAIGQATKLIELMHTRPKEYLGTGLLGYATDSYDASGHIIKKEELKKAVPADVLKQTMTKFTGQIKQVPPVYSAVKVNGKHLYEYARAGMPVKRPVRTVTVYDYSLRKQPYFDPAKGQESFAFRIKCGKGTYVRSLVNDLGEKIGLPAVMTNLRRTQSGGFTLKEAVKLSDLEKNSDQVKELLQPIDSFFKEYPVFDLSAKKWQKVKNGAGIHLESDAKKVALRYNDKVKAIYQKKGHLYRPDLMLLANK